MRYVEVTLEQLREGSREVLSARPSDLAVIRARDLGWSDLGEPERTLSLLRLKGRTCERGDL
jgi:hypothetical protein